jgi:aspartate/methionine/tyrosine aminotransferase
MGSTSIQKSFFKFSVLLYRYSTAVMIPIPQYPLFSGTLSELGIRMAEYYLDEAHEWALTRDELDRCWKEADATTAVRAIVVINPGNPTGQVSLFSFYCFTHSESSGDNIITHYR